MIFLEKAEALAECFRTITWVYMAIDQQVEFNFFHWTILDYKSHLYTRKHYSIVNVLFTMFPWR